MKELKDITLIIFDRLLLTMVILLPIAMLNVYYYSIVTKQFSFLEAIVVAIGIVILFLSLKVSYLISFHNVLYSKKFEGSHFTAAIIVTLMICIGATIVCSVACGGKFPISSSDAIVVLPLFFLAFIIGLFMCFKLSSWFVK